MAVCRIAGSSMGLSAGKLFKVITHFKKAGQLAMCMELAKMHLFHLVVHNWHLSPWSPKMLVRRSLGSRSVLIYVRHVFARFVTNVRLAPALCFVYGRSVFALNLACVRSALVLCSVWLRSVFGLWFGRVLVGVR